ARLVHRNPGSHGRAAGSFYILILYVNIDVAIKPFLPCSRMKPQILQLNPILVPAINDQLASLYTVHRYFELRERQAWLREQGPSIAAVITGGHTGISREMLERMPRLKVVAVNGVGTDAVDLAYCRERRLPVTATLGALTEDVADLAIGLLIAACRNLCAGDRFVRHGQSELHPQPSP